MECSKKAGLLLTIQCKDVSKALVNCLQKCFYDEQLREECTREYLKERSEYRTTGVSKKSRRKPSVI